jgi:cell division protein FtsB
LSLARARTLNAWIATTKRLLDSISVTSAVIHRAVKRENQADSGRRSGLESVKRFGSSLAPGNPGEAPMRIQKFDSVVSLACLSLMAFFAWHAFKGPRGFAYREALGQQVAKLESDLSAVSAKRDAFEARVTLLRPDSLDPDMLDEMARQTLNLAKPNELIVRNPQ